MNKNQIGLFDVSEVSLIYKTKFPASERKLIKSSQDAFDIFFASWNPDTIEYREEFKVLLLNRSHKVLGITTISQGGVTGTVIDVKMIFQAALKLNASSIILAHNHPSGNTNPSEADRAITKKIYEAGKVMDITVLDHLILTQPSNYYSFADSGDM
jgi:DNA repair protein RadC